MTPEQVLGQGRDALQLALLISAPLLLTALAVGVIVGLFQAATQINEMTLSFIPKLLAMAAVLVVTGPWMLRLLVEYTRRLIESIPGLVSCWLPAFLGWGAGGGPPLGPGGSPKTYFAQRRVTFLCLCKEK